MSKGWEKSTGPRTTEGKARVAQNAYKGGYWKQSRELTKALNAALREQEAARERVQ